MRQGIPRGIGLHTHYTLEKAKSNIKMSERVLTVKEKQRVRCEQADIKRAEQRATREKETHERVAKAAPRARHPRRPSPVTSQPQIPVGKSLMTVKMMERAQQQAGAAESSEEDEEASCPLPPKSSSPPSYPPPASPPSVPVTRRPESPSPPPVRARA